MSLAASHHVERKGQLDSPPTQSRRLVRAVLSVAVLFAALRQPAIAADKPSNWVSQDGNRGGTAARGTGAKFIVTPSAPLMGDQLHITIAGLPSNQSITLQATSRAQDGVLWKSTAVHQSGTDGRIDLGAQAPNSGDYEGIDAMGLFWSMKPNAEPKSGDHSFFAVTNWSAVVSTAIECSSQGRRLGSVTVERRFAKEGIRCTEIRENGIVGSLWEPNDTRLRPGVIVLGGSEGGNANCEAPMVASHGFRVLSLAYFGVAGLPPTMQKLPVEYFGRALQWMRARHGVDPEFVALYGISRGAEAALTVAATYPEVKAVVARSPSHVRWEGVSSISLPAGPLWTVHGKALPYVPIAISSAFATQFMQDRMAGRPNRQTPLFVEALQRFGDTSKAEIPVEQIRGPVLLLSGKDDQVWPSSMMAGRVMERLKRNRHAYPDEHLSYKGVGHWMPTGIVPMRGVRDTMKLAIGGSAAQTAKMQADCWAKIVRFLIKASTTQKESGR
jgi:pimeloyl-ACP methyl ester carboxylesterase